MLIVSKVKKHNHVIFSIFFKIKIITGILMSTHNIQFHDKIKDLELSQSSYGKIIPGTPEKV